MSIILSYFADCRQEVLPKHFMLITMFAGFIFDVLVPEMRQVSTLVDLVYGVFSLLSSLLKRLIFRTSRLDSVAQERLSFFIW